MQKGIIVSNISNLYDVEIDNKIFSCNARGKFKSNDITPVTGDIVEIEITDENKNIGVINKIEERKNYIKRPKIANITQIIFVVSMNMPKPDLLLLDKQLAFAEAMSVNPIICINKIDLESEDKSCLIENLYKSIGYRVIKTNAKIGENVEMIREVLKGNITAFSGNSGVGKSTLINNIFEQYLTEEGDISLKNKKGKNTTTSVKLYKIDNNSYIADTPGFSTFDITEITSEELSKYFVEFNNYISECKYIGCSHIKENECGVKKAVADNKISTTRYENYCKIYNDLKDKEDNKW